ncbi:hypothetical protein J6590_004453 [Homalodisca vitripennis]|nr:hypothetical protein J6590_004453 [Homalodisca vitripennis]
MSRDISIVLGSFSDIFTLLEGNSKEVPPPDGEVGSPRGADCTEDDEAHHSFEFGRCTEHKITLVSTETVAGIMLRSENTCSVVSAFVQVVLPVKQEELPR